MSRTITVEGDLNAVDTRTNLTAQGSVAAPSLVVPAGVNKIKSLIFAAGIDHLANGNVVFLVRLGGNAVLNGEQTIVVGGTGGTIDAAPIDAVPGTMLAQVLKDLNIDVRPSDTINISVEMAGADVGDTTAVITLVYGK